jgi:tetratricopeptide (TPR) repeat protein
LYKVSANLLDENLYDFPLFKKDIMCEEAAVFNNLAFCYQREGNDKSSIEFATKVVDRTPYLNDIQLLIKALTRRGNCYITAEKYKLAADDLARVRDLDPMNKQASDGLRNALKYIK